MITVSSNPEVKSLFVEVNGKNGLDEVLVDAFADVPDPGGLRKPDV